MAKEKIKYTCCNCGSVSAKWAGQCSDCGEWGSLVEEKPMSAKTSSKKGNLLEPEILKPGEDVDKNAA